MLRIGWLARVCCCLRQDGLGGWLESKIFCPLSGRDGKDRLAKRHGHRFGKGGTGYCVGNLGEFGGETADGEDGLDRMGERNGWEGYGGKSMYIHKKDSCVHKNLTYPFTNKDFYATIQIRRYCRGIKNRRKVLSQFYP